MLHTSQGKGLSENRYSHTCHTVLGTHLPPFSSTGPIAELRFHLPPSSFSKALSAYARTGWEPCGSSFWLCCGVWVIRSIRAPGKVWGLRELAGALWAGQTPNFGWFALRVSLSKEKRVTGFHLKGCMLIFIALDLPRLTQLYRNRSHSVHTCMEIGAIQYIIAGWINEWLYLSISEHNHDQIQVKRLGSEQPGFESQLCPLLPLYSRIAYLTSPYFSFMVCKTQNGIHF